MFRLEGWLLVTGAFVLASGYGVLWAWTGGRYKSPLSRFQSVLLKAVLMSGTMLVLVHAVLLRDIVMGVGVLLALGIALGIIRSRS